jgi:glycosyltransferase involved in cell wall biosynthesis
VGPDEGTGRNAGVYLSTAKETFGIGILEALACGVPVLGYAHGGILDLVQHKSEWLPGRAGRR